MKQHSTLLLAVLFLTNMALSAELDGKWVGQCIEEDQGFSNQSLIISESKHTAVADVVFFSEAGCQTKLYGARVANTFQIGKESLIISGAKEMDSIYSTMELTVYHPQLVAQLNSIAVCGYKDWELNKPKDIAGKTCGNTTLPKVGDSSYDIFKVDSNTMLLGKTTTEFDGTTPEKRPRELDAAHQMKKQ